MSRNTETPTHDETPSSREPLHGCLDDSPLDGATCGVLYGNVRDDGRNLSVGCGAAEETLE